MKKKNRLTRSKDFKRVKDVGKSVYHPLIVLVYAPNDLKLTRVAVVASKAIGNAVVRNRIKRRLKSCLDLILTDKDQSWDFIFYSRAKIVGATKTEIHDAIQHLFSEAGVLGENN